MAPIVVTSPEADGLKMMMKVPPDSSGCMKCMFGCFTCGQNQMTMTNRVYGDGTVAGVDPTLCGCIKMSPCPCLACCGYGPCAGKFMFKKDEADPTKWVGFGSVFAGGCCTVCMHHNGDTFIYDAEHTGEAGKPMEMVAGNNPSSPPCFIGKVVGHMYIHSEIKGGAPQVAEMGR